MAVRVEEHSTIAAELGAYPLLAPLPHVIDRAKADRWAGKRLLDLALSMALILAAAPLLLAIAAAIKLASPKEPVFFRHKRVGCAGKEFWLLKFRTMQSDAEQRLQAEKELLELYVCGDHKIPLRLDPRITKLGRFLRRSSLDELPQLFNVLMGQMSLVGPRPVERLQLSQYGHRKAFYLGLRPGITGSWQVGGRSTVKFPRRAEIDEEYFRRCTLGLDLRILMRTPQAIIRGLNAD